MKKLLVMGAAAAFALAMSGCGTDVPSPNKYIDQAKSAAAQAGDAGQEAAGGALGGDPNAPICVDAGTPGMQAVFFGLQILAQPNLDTVQQIRDDNGAVGPLYDPVAIGQGITDYRVLDGHAAPGFKDPKEILDLWQNLNDRMAGMVSAGSDPTQADIDSYNMAMGDQQGLIMSQLDVTMAKETYCQK